MDDFLNRLLVNLEERKITQTQLADDIGISRSAISDWKKGKGKPSFETLKKISKRLDISIDYLAFGVENNLSPEDTELLKRFHSIPAELHDRVFAYMDGLSEIGK